MIQVFFGQQTDWWDRVIAALPFAIGFGGLLLAYLQHRGNNRLQLKLKRFEVTFLAKQVLYQKILSGLYRTMTHAANAGVRGVASSEFRGELASVEAAIFSAEPFLDNAGREWLQRVGKEWFNHIEGLLKETDESKVPVRTEAFRKWVQETVRPALLHHLFPPEKSRKRGGTGLS